MLFITHKHIKTNKKYKIRKLTKRLSDSDLSFFTSALSMLPLFLPLLFQLQLSLGFPLPLGVVFGHPAHEVGPLLQCHQSSKSSYA